MEQLKTLLGKFVVEDLVLELKEMKDILVKVRIQFIFFFFVFPIFLNNNNKT